MANSLVCLVDAAVAAKHFGVRVSWFREQTRQRAIPFYRLGHYVRFDLDELQEFFRTRNVAVVA